MPDPREQEQQYIRNLLTIIRRRRTSADEAMHLDAIVDRVLAGTLTPPNRYVITAYVELQAAQVFRKLQSTADAADRAVATAQLRDLECALDHLYNTLPANPTE